MSGAVGLVLRNPFLTYALVGALFAAMVYFVNAQYDAGGFKGALFWLSQIFLLPFLACRELLLTLSGGIGAGWQVAVSAVFQLGFCLLADLALRRFI